MSLTGQENYIAELEHQVLNLLNKHKIEPLCKSLRDNKGKFSFISDREFTTSYNPNCEKIKKRVASQTKALDEVIAEIKKFSDMPVSESGHQGIFTLLSPLKDYALQYGYNEQAAEILQILKSTQLVGDLATASVSKDLLRIIDNYGKRFIMERDPDLKAQADQVIVDVLSGKFGEDTKKELSMENMEKTYEDATVVKGDITFKTDGTHHYYK